VAEADVFLGILGMRYGSKAKGSGKSFTRIYDGAETDETLEGYKHGMRSFRVVVRDALLQMSSATTAPLEPSNPH
jgi:hypothetical protein